MGLELIQDEIIKSRIYIAGPMRGYDECNYPAFYKAERHLKNELLWEPINPARMDEDVSDTINYKDALKRDIDEIFTADFLYMLRGWEKSEGARVEHALAIYLGLGILYQ